jgi:hypothetical protein
LSSSAKALLKLGLLTEFRISQSNRIDTAAHRPTGLGLAVAGRQTQNDLRAHGLSHASAPSSASTVQHFSLRRRNHDTFRHPLFLQQPPINNQCNGTLEFPGCEQELSRCLCGSEAVPRYCVLVKQSVDPDSRLWLLHFRCSNRAPEYLSLSRSSSMRRHRSAVAAERVSARILQVRLSRPQPSFSGD